MTEPITAATSHEDVVIRAAREDDIADITRIHNQGIVERIATLDADPKEETERRTWLGGRSPRHAVLVAERDGRLVGWASLNAYNVRHAYRFVADLSVYVDRQDRGRGIGTLLLQALIAAAIEHGFHKLVLIALPHNAAALALYARHGFRKVGVFREQGALDGRWVDAVAMELLLDTNPPPAS